jgi:hypothetical protein
MKVGVRAIGAGLAALITAAASAGTISDPVITIQASSSLGSGTYTVPYIPGNYNPETGVYNWASTGEVDILGENEQIIATISQLSTFIMVDPVVNVGFVLTAGAADTSVSITSALVSFAAIPNALAQASAQIGATDTDGNGANITGGFGGLGYQARTNLGVFGTTVPSFAVGTFGSSNQNGSLGPAVIGTVTSMEAEFDFTVTANDAASGTSVFVVTPEPASLALLGLAGLLAFRRR